MNQNQTSRPPMGGGPMGHGPRGMMIPGGKARDFKGTLQKTIRFMRSSVPVILLAFLLAIGSVILTLNIPKVLGNATDEIMVGLMKRNVYDTIMDTQKAMEKMRKALADIPPQQMAALAQDENATLGTLMEQGLLPEDALDGLDKNLRQTLSALPLSQLSQMGQSGQAQSFETIGDYLSSMENGQSIIENIPPQYQDELLETSLQSRPGIDQEAVGHIIMVLIVLILLGAILGYLQNFLMSGVAQKVSYQLRDQINKKMNRLPLSFYDKTTHGETLSLISNDVDTVSTTLNQSLTQMITAITTLLGVLVMMFSISGWMTLTSLITLPLSFLIISLVVRRSQRHFRTQQEYLGHVNGHIEEMYSGHNVVRLFNGEERSRETFHQMNKKLYAAGWRSQFLSGLMQPVLSFVSNLGYVAVCVLGGYLTIHGRITIGDIQSFIQYVRRFNQPVMQSAQIMNTLQSTVAAAERVFTFLEQPEEADDGKAKLPAEGVRGDVTFDHVDFGYTPEKTIIHDFSTHVKDGQRIAIVGPTGAGKTTIVKLLMHFYELNSGRILLDGVDIKDLPRGVLRSQIGMVLQDTWLFNGTIRDNIRYGRLDATDEEVEKAARMACADHFIRTLPRGYDFVLNEEASNVSHGQKQLLTIARAILADPAVLILDEATSSVDTRTEVLIQQAMNRLMQGRTSFIIAHRLSTIRDADRILVLREGDIVEQGTHEELLEKGGFYANLYNSQFEPTGEAV
ncbi:ABC transporter ATP-binding protein [Intestinimonas sp. MSJ-38]|uniref:ABC transporter ATP-binding protein n=1 Tax=Intestinimonas sp. MSJ-38 TaxID=2841532 RepID=UPI00209EE042|nr:ABC transporter ATP-binding protein [Intestinimonas sp. MSJ-38]